MKNQYEVDVENVLACPNNERTRNPIRNLKFFHYNRTHKALNLDFTYDKPLDEKVGGSIVVERWGGGMVDGSKYPSWVSSRTSARTCSDSLRRCGFISTRKLELHIQIVVLSLR
jgi:hypothetical protein